MGPDPDRDPGTEQALKPDALVYESARTMPAIAMVERPEIGHVVDVLRMIDVSVPRPTADQVAIKLAASAMHIDEILAAQGTALGRFYGPKQVSEAEPYIMGSSVSGTVVARGAKVTAFDIGDEVIAIPDETGDIGSWARYRCVKQSMVLAKPAEFDHVRATALTMAACVAWGAVGLGNIKVGQKCLVVGASGAIGILIVQILKSMGAHVTGVCSGRNAGFVRGHGADDIIDYTTGNFADAGKGTFDTVFDIIGGKETERGASRILKTTGRFITIVGPVRHIGETRLSWPEFTAALAHIAWRYLGSRVSGPRYIFCARLPRKTIRPAIAHLLQHHIRMPIEAEIPFDVDAVKRAIKLLTSHRAKGRIVINFQKPGEQITLEDSEPRGEGGRD